MDKVLLHPAYFGPLSQFTVMAQASEIVFENEDNYQKQTYRNRMYIYGANGKLLLNVPVKHTGNKTQHQKYREVRIENDFRWQDQHWKSLQTAYRTSPFFEFYEDDFAPLYEKSYEFLLDFNYDCLEIVLDSLQLDPEIKKSEKYQKHPEGLTDARRLINAKGEKSFAPDPYNQVFENKYGYIADLSVVDLIFNEGPNALNYLKQQRSPLL